jgi:hypothetical protein
MAVPIIGELLQLLLGLAAPAAVCTMFLAGTALRQEGGVTFHTGGNFQKWIIWTAIFLTLPGLLSWFAAQGITVPAQPGTGSGWVGALQTDFQSFVSGFLLGHIVPITAAFFVLKAALDAAQGHSPLGSIVAAIFMLSISGTTQLFQSWNDDSQFAVTDMLVSAWNFLAGHILPEAAGLAIIGAIVNYARHRPVGSLVASAMAFLSISAVWKLIQAWVIS